VTHGRVASVWLCEWGRRRAARARVVCSRCVHLALGALGLLSRARTFAAVVHPRGRVLSRWRAGCVCLRDLGAHGLRPVFCAIADR